MGILAFHLYQNWEDRRRERRERESAVEAEIAEIVEVEPRKPGKPKQEPTVIPLELEEKAPAVSRPDRGGSRRSGGKPDYAADALRESRPELRRTQVVCFKCNKAVEKLSSTGMHKGKAPGEFGGGAKAEGWVMAMAQCHGDYCDIVVPFSELRKNPCLVVTVFEHPAARLVAPFGSCGIGGAKKPLPEKKRGLTYLQGPSRFDL